MSHSQLIRAMQDFAVSPHGRQAASSGLSDWLLVGLCVLSVLLAFGLCLRFFLRPGELDPTHIKWEVLRDTIPH